MAKSHPRGHWCPDSRCRRKGRDQARSGNGISSAGESPVRRTPRSFANCVALSIASSPCTPLHAQHKDVFGNFAAHLIDEGAGTLRARAFQPALGSRAIRLSVTAELDYLIVSLVTLSSNAKDAFQLLGQALSRPRFDGDAIVRVRGQILADLAQQEQDPPAVAEKGFYQVFFADHPYAHSVAGTARSISTINTADLRRFAATHWVSRG